MMVDTLYNPAVYLTPDEYYQFTDERIDVQKYVEQPHFYIFARTTIQSMTSYFILTPGGKI